MVQFEDIFYPHGSKLGDNKTIQQFMSRSMVVYWGPGASNKYGYYIKHFLASHHREVRYDYLHPTPDGRNYTQGIIPRDLRGCANLAIYLGTRLFQDKARL